MITLKILRVALCLVALTAGSAFAQTGDTATFIFARHAEKAAEPASDPPLTVQGVQRAKALATALKDAGVTRIITTQYLRTRETALPLADLAVIKPETMSVERGKLPEHIVAVAESLRAQKGGVTVVIGHGNTITRMMEALGAPKMADICEATHGRLFVLVHDKGKPRLVEARFGAAEPELNADCKEIKP